MNPAMLEASDDLTNLSHLNEPAGTVHELLGFRNFFFANKILQCCRRSSCAMRRKRFTHTRVSFLLRRIPSPVLILSTSLAWSRCMLENRGPMEHRICLPLQKKLLRKYPSAFIIACELCHMLLAPLFCYEHGVVTIP